MKYSSLMRVCCLVVAVATLLVCAVGTKADLAAANRQKTFNIVSYGAVPDGRTLSTDAIQKALDACGHAGGGIVKVPAGTYLTGTLDLRDNVTLSVEAGATLLGSTHMEDYRPKFVIFGNGVKNVTLIGPGVIDGQGYAFWTKKPSMPSNDLGNINFARIHYWGHNPRNSGHLVMLSNCTNVKISNLTLQNSQSWTLHLLACENVSVDHVRIRNRLYGPNTDGIDIDGSQDVQVSNCDICTGDDAMVLKNRSDTVTFPHSCENVTITDCKLISPTNAFKIGTETYGDFENIVFKNSVIEAGDPKDPWCTEAAAMVSPQFYGNGLGPETGIAVESADGSHIHGVTVSNIVMHDVQSPIFIRLGDRGINPTNARVKAATGTIDDVTISDVSADGAWGPSIIAGVPDHPVQDVTITNLRVTNIGNGTSSSTPLGVKEAIDDYPSSLMWGPLPANSLYFRHANGIKLSNVTIANAKPDTRLPVIVDDVTGLAIEGITLDHAASSDPVMLLNNVRDSQIRGTVPEQTKTWANVSGGLSSHIVLSPDKAKNAKQIFMAGAGAASNAVSVAPIATKM